MLVTKVLNENRDFRRLYARAKFLAHPILVTYAQRNSFGINRIGITATKKTGNAVLRNRSRRIIKAAYLSLEKELRPGWDFVFVARAKTSQMKSTDILPVMKNHIEKLTAKKPPAAKLPAAALNDEKTADILNQPL